jgi:hypothetical protein
MAFPIILPTGDHELAEQVVDWSVTFIDSQPPGVKLTASVAGGPTPPIFPTQGKTATILAIQMDARVASVLYEKLGNLGRSMGWLPQIEGDSQVSRR